MNDESKQNASDEPDYDPKFHVTAAELRAAGIPVPKEIPDPAWILRSAIIPAVTVHDPAKGPPDMMSATLRLEFAAPWRWATASVTIPKEATKPCPTCGGRGRRAAQIDGDAMVPPCPDCNGTGTVPKDLGAE